jgi:hypothetical protein
MSDIGTKRKMAPTGGNRSWSEEEVSFSCARNITTDELTDRQENYLLQTRMQKMPYKHIAAHLKKTELACRLHYHQLSHGSHRRKRTSSVSSSNSSASSTRHSPTQYHLSGPYDGSDGLNGTHDYFSTPSLGSYPSMNGSPSGARIQHKLLLPKPRPITPEESPNRITAAHGLRINTGLSGSPGSSVDTDRLRQIYDSHRNNFWSAVAADYGRDVSPSQLEEIWRHSHNVIRPPTPSDSPNGSTGILKPSPFAHPGPYPTLPSSKDYSPLSAQVTSAVSAPDRLAYHSYPTPTSTTQDPYQGTPVLPAQFSRSNTWGAQSMNGLGMGLGTHTLQSHHGGSHTPATAITSLLTDNKCPRHGEYCVGGHCLN